MEGEKSGEQEESERGGGKFSCRAHGLKVPEALYALHYDEGSGEFYYDGEELQVFDRGKEEERWLKKAGRMVEDYMMVVEEDERRRGNPVWREVEEYSEEEMHMLAACEVAAEEKPSWKLGGQLQPEERDQVVELLEQNRGIFAHSVEDLGGFVGEPMGVELTDERKAIWSHPHKLSRAEWDFVGENCEKLERQGLIRESKQSKYASATVVVRKRDENGEYTDLRQCGDYRPLNLATDSDRYPLPLIEEIFHEMQGAKIFSKLDLRSGYHQIPLREEDKGKTAFWGRNRKLWEWNVVPFGLKNAPPFFQRLMDRVLQGLSFARCYIDDIIVWSNNLQEHLEHLQEVFRRLEGIGLKITLESVCSRRRR